MAKQREKKPRTPLDPVDVLEGRASASAPDLLELIQRVNPTGLDLPAKETARRYALKRRLQSLLVRRYPDDITVQPDPRDAAVVLLSPRSGGPGSHTRLDELDEDARALLRRQLDEAEHEPRAHNPPRKAPRTRPPDGASPLAQHLQAGQAARAAYDYEAACEHFRSALTLSEGESTAALALLSVWVEDLATDDQALALEAQLPAATLAHPHVRLLLAIAAARSGHRPRAAALIKGLDHPRLGEVLLLQAEAALRQDDLTAATELIEEARAQGGSGPELLRLTEEVFQRRAGQRAELEEAIRAALAADDEAAAERRAQEVLARWPESDVAGRALRELKARAHTREALSLLGRAEAALREDRPTSARSHLAQALALSVGGDLRGALLRCLEEAQRAEQQQREADQLAHTLRLLSTPADLLEGLRTYAELPPPLRARVHAHAEPPRRVALEQLEELGPLRTSRGAAEAVLALAQARHLTDPDAVCEILAHHAKFLDSLAAAQALRQLALRLREARLREHATRTLQEAVDARAAADFERVLRLLAGPELRSLNDDEQALVQRLRREAQEMLGEINDEATFSHLLDLTTVPGYMQARRMAQHLSERSSAAHQEMWRKRYALAHHFVQTLFCARRYPPAQPELVLGSVVEIHAPLQLLLPGGDEAAQVYSAGQWHFVRIVHVGSGAVRARFTLKTPDTIENVTPLVDEDSLWLLGKGALQVHLADNNIQRWIPAAELLSPELPHSTTNLAPGSRYLWCMVKSPGPENSRDAHIYDVLHGNHVRVLEVANVARLLPGTQVVYSTRLGMLTLQDPRGTLLRRYPLGDEEWSPTVCRSPDGDGLIALIASPPSAVQEGLPLPPLHYLHLRPDQPEAPTRWPMPGLDPAGMHTASTAADLGLVFFLTQSHFDERRWLCAMRLEAGRLQVIYQVEVPQFSQLLTDPAGRKVVLKARYEEGDLLIALDANPPRRGTPLPIADTLPSISGALPCSHAQAGRALIERLANAEQITAPAQRRQRAPELMARYQHSPDLLADYLHTLAYDEVSAAADPLRWELIGQAAQRYPAHPRIQLLQAEALLCNGRWDEARRLLEGLDLRALPARYSDEAMHGYHMLGMALVRARQPEAARPVLQEGHRRLHGRGECPLGQMLQVVGAPDPAHLDGWLELLLQRRRRADELEERGDLPGALAALDHVVVWYSQERNCWNRYAELALRCVEAGHPVDAFHVSMVLNTFIHVIQQASRGVTREVAYPRKAWDEEEMVDLARRAVRYIGGSTINRVKALQARLAAALSDAEQGLDSEPDLLEELMEYSSDGF